MIAEGGSDTVRVDVHREIQIGRRSRRLGETGKPDVIG
jgi:hypothetical protein